MKNKEAEDSDDEKEESELQQLEQLLRQHDTQFIKYVCCQVVLHVYGYEIVCLISLESQSRPSHPAIDTAAYYQLNLGIERFRCRF